MPSQTSLPPHTHTHTRSILHSVPSFTGSSKWPRPPSVWNLRGAALWQPPLGRSSLWLSFTQLRLPLCSLRLRAPGEPLRLMLKSSTRSTRSPPLPLLHSSSASTLPAWPCQACTSPAPAFPAPLRLLCPRLKSWPAVFLTAHLLREAHADKEAVTYAHTLSLKWRLHDSAVCPREHTTGGGICFSSSSREVGSPSDDLGL